MTSTRIGGDARALQGHRAGFVTRAVADGIDAVLVVVLWFGGLWFAGMVRFLFRPRHGLHVPQVPSGVAVVCVVLLAIVYLTAFVAATGRTLGKRFGGLRVSTSHGTRVGAARAFLRSTLSVLVPIGFLWVLVSERNRSLADIVTGTAVVYDWGLTWTPAAVEPPASPAS